MVLKKIRKKLGIGKNDVKSNYSKTSYSQSGEDLIVDFIFDALGINHPSYIDIGAHHPYYLSNTGIFYERGCKGINVEPDPVLFKEFILHRKNDINLNIGIGNKKEVLDFYLMSAPTLNTFSHDEAQKFIREGNYTITETCKIEVDTLSSIIQFHNKGKFPDFLSLDAEGIDELVLKSIDYNISSPLVICVESLTFSTTGHGAKNKNIISFLEQQGYKLYADTNINSIFVKRDLWER